MFRYYSTQRPVAPGTFPKKAGCIVHNFETIQRVPELSAEAWGYIDYPEPLTIQEAVSYALLDARINEHLKVWYGVITFIYDGRVKSALSEMRLAAEKPESTSGIRSGGDICIEWHLDWYATKKLAKEAAAEAQTE